MNTLSRLETGAVDFVARTVPWFSPLPTAYLTAQATVRHLGWPGGMGVVAGAIIEGLGLASVATALELREYNATRRKSDPKAPFRLTVALAGVYLASVTALTVVLDTAPRLATYAPLIFPLMSLTGATLLAIRADHRRRLKAIVADKAARSHSRKEGARKAQLAASGTQEKRKQAQLAARQAQEQRHALARGGNLLATARLFRASPTLSHASAAHELGVSRQAVGQYLAKLERLNVIRRNGSGVEVLVDLDSLGL
jgi:hypothetical protein